MLSEWAAAKAPITFRTAALQDLPQIKTVYQKIVRHMNAHHIGIWDEHYPFDFLEEDDSAFDPESGELVLGDIVISKERVIAQSEEYGHSIRREYAFLIAHSMLHLFGYDHMEEEERAEMEAHQRAIMEKVGTPR